MADKPPAPYSVTTHAVIGLAEWLAINYGDQGIGVSVLCPQAVRTAMTAGVDAGAVSAVDGMLEPAQVADAVGRPLTTTGGFGGCASCRTVCIGRTRIK